MTMTMITHCICAGSLKEAPPSQQTMLPTLEQSVGFHSLPDGGLPALLYFEGLSRYRKRGELIQNRVFFVQP